MQRAVEGCVSAMALQKLVFEEPLPEWWSAVFVGSIEE
jgi:hypothetical protein